MSSHVGPYVTAKQSHGPLILIRPYTAGIPETLVVENYSS